MITKWLMLLCDQSAFNGSGRRLWLTADGREPTYDGGSVHWLELRFRSCDDGAFEISMPATVPIGKVFRNGVETSVVEPTELEIQTVNGRHRLFFRAYDLGKGGCTRWSFGRKWKDECGAKPSRLQVMVRREPHW